MATWTRQIGDVAVRTFLHRLGGAVSMDVAILLLDVASSGAARNADVHHVTTELAAAQRGLAVMQADATRLQRRVAQCEAEVAQWQARAEQALRAGDASLARQALARKRALHRVAAQYAEALSAQQRSLDQVQVAVAHLEAQVCAVQVSRASGVRFRPGLANPIAVHDQETVEARWERFELDQAMDALRRTMPR